MLAPECLASFFRNVVQCIAKYILISVIIFSHFIGCEIIISLFVFLTSFIVKPGRFYRLCTFCDWVEVFRNLWEMVFTCCYII